MLKKASNAHAGQAKDLEKAVKEDSENEGFASDAQRRAAFASGYKEKGKKKDESAASDARRAMLLTHLQNKSSPRMFLQLMMM